MKTRTQGLLVTAVVLGVLAGRASAAPYAVGTELTVAIGCPTEAASDPALTFSLTNVGNARAEINQQIPIHLLLQLTVKDSRGKVITAGHYVSGTRSIVPSQILQPGKTLMLSDWIFDEGRRESSIPLHAFGYKLPVGSYSVSASTGIAGGPTSNTCRVEVN